MLSEAHSESSQTSKMKLFGKLVNGWKALTIFIKSPIFDVWLDSEYVSGEENCIIYFLRLCNVGWKNILSFFLMEILENHGMGGLTQVSLIIHYLFQYIQFIGILSYSRPNQVKFMEDSF